MRVRIREFSTGIGLLLRGFAVWRTRPGLMALGLVPAIIALVLLIAAIVPLVLNMGSITTWATPFADGWAEPWRSLFRSAVDSPASPRPTCGNDCWPPAAGWSPAPA